MSKKRDPEKVLTEFLRMLRYGRIETVVVAGKRPDDPWRSRIKGASGADYPVNEAHPLDYHLKVAEARFNAELAKVMRVSNLHECRKLATETRSRRAHLVEGQVLALAALPIYANKGRGMAGAIAKRVNLHPSTVRRIIRKARQRNAHD